VIHEIKAMDKIVKWMLSNATEIGLVLGIIGVISGLVYLYDFYSTRKKKKGKHPDIIPREIESSLHGDAENYADAWRKRLENIYSDANAGNEEHRK